MTEEDYYSLFKSCAPFQGLTLFDCSFVRSCVRSYARSVFFLSFLDDFQRKDFTIKQRIQCRRKCLVSAFNVLNKCINSSLFINKLLSFCVYVMYASCFDYYKNASLMMTTLSSQQDRDIADDKLVKPTGQRHSR